MHDHKNAFVSSLTLIIVATLVMCGCESTSPDATPADATMTAETLEPLSLGDFKRLHTYDDIFLASQPSETDLELLSQEGVRTVINQRPESEMTGFDERTTVESLGLRYENPGWNGPNQLSDEIINHTRELLRTAPRPILMHCSSANRAGAIWLAYRTLDDGVDVDEAAREARTVGLRTPEYEVIVRNYIERHR